MAASSLFATLLDALVAGFVLVTFALLALTLRNRLCAPRPLLSWRSRRFARAAMWPLLFVGGVFILAAVAVPEGDVHGLLIVVGAAIGGACWLLSLFVAHTVIVHEGGLMRHLNHTQEHLTWREVEDYFEGGDAPWHYGFFFRNDHGDRCRIDLYVPRALRKRFSQIVTSCVDTRFDVSVRMPSGKKTMEG